jgi:hypothetical protein
MSKVLDKMFLRRAAKVEAHLRSALSQLAGIHMDGGNVLAGAMLCEESTAAARFASDLNKVVWRISEERRDKRKGGR